MNKITKSIMLAVPMLALTIQGGLFGMDNKQELLNIIDKMPIDKKNDLRSAMVRGWGQATNLDRMKRDENFGGKKFDGDLKKD